MWRWLVGVGGLVMGVVILGVVVPEQAGFGPKSVQAQQGDDPAPSRALRPAGSGIPVYVFFSRHPESDDDFTAVFPVGRNSPHLGVGRFAQERLIAGPTPEERAAGHFSELGEMLSGPSDCGGPDFTLGLQDGLATVRFCRAAVSAGIGQDARVTSQIRATLLQFPTVRRVRLLSSDGNCLFDQSGLNVCLRD